MRAFIIAGCIVLASVPVAAQTPDRSYYRFTLTDGRQVYGYAVGGDAVNLFVQTSAGVFSIARATIARSDVYGQAQQPMQAIPPAPPPVLAPSEPQKPDKFKMGLGLFVGSYLTTAAIALGRGKDDPDARLGLIPIAGPILWTRTDDDEWGKDGWDWLALLSAFMQGGGAYAMIAGLVESPSNPPQTTTIVPVTSASYFGLALGGTF